MTILTVEQLKRIAIGRPNAAQTKNMTSFVDAVNRFGEPLDLHYLYNLSSIIGQVMVESGEFKYDQEIWGPTAQQKKYDTGKLAKTLGNTPQADGDGKKHKGFGPIQLTGKYNQSRFYKWALENHERLGAPRPPNFVEDPRKITTDPWEGLSALWYWHEGNPEGVSLNKYARQNNQLMVTRRVNGGTTHYAERLNYQARAALVLLGYGVSREEVRRFQRDHQPTAGVVDGLIGDRTRDALHLAMKGTVPVTTVQVDTVEKEVKVPVVVEDLEKPWYKDVEGVKEVVTTVGVPSILSFFTDIPTDKLLILMGILAVGGLFWYLNRRSKAKKQEKAVKEVKSAPATTMLVSREVEVK